jgi:hypothetical protein
MVSALAKTSLARVQQQWIDLRHRDAAPMAAFDRIYTHCCHRKGPGRIPVLFLSHSDKNITRAMAMRAMASDRFVGNRTLRFGVWNCGIALTMNFLRGG